MRSRLQLAAITFSLIVTMVCWASAQTQSQEPEQEGTTQQPRTDQQDTRADGAQRHLDWLSQQLSLTDDQKAKLQPILQNEEQQMMSIHHDTSLTREQKRNQMRQVHQSTERQIQGILTPEQRQKFAQIKKERRERRQQNMGASGENQSKQ